MQVEAVPLTDFVHGGLRARQGQPTVMNEYMAAQLERAGLVRIKLVPAANIVAADAGKVQGDGMGPPSSSSLPAQALPPATLPMSKPGGIRHRKAAVSSP